MHSQGLLISSARREKEGEKERELSIPEAFVRAFSVASEIDPTTKYGARFLACDMRVRSMLSRMVCEDTAPATCH